MVIVETHTHTSSTNKTENMKEERSHQCHYHDCHFVLEFCNPTVHKGFNFSTSSLTLVTLCELEKWISRHRHPPGV